MMRKTSIIVLLLLLLPLACEQVVDTFIHYSDSLSWTNAQAFCRKYHTDLVTVTSETENQNIFITQRWIGLYFDASEHSWKWSTGDQIATFTNWDAGEPRANNNCAFKYSNTLKWRTDGCDLTHTFICYGYGMLLVKENKTWEEALNYCRSLEAVDPSRPATDYNNSRYDLATVITQDDYKRAMDEILDATTAEVWMGLRYLAGQWMWVGGEIAQYNNIQNCTAQEFCGILVKNSTIQYETRNCEQRRNFVCYKKPLPTIGN